jgi:hypothetical protein
MSLRAPIPGRGRHDSKDVLFEHIPFTQMGIETRLTERDPEKGEPSDMDRPVCWNMARTARTARRSHGVEAEC